MFAFNRLLWTTLLLVFAGTAGSFAEDPVPIESVAPVDEIMLEIDVQIELLSKFLSTEAGFEDQREGQIRQSFGLLACLGQALAEHDQAKADEVQGAALRDGALQFSLKSTLEQAKQAFEQVQLARSGKATGDHATEYPWNKLFNMHPMMEEMNARNSAILRVLRRPRGNPDESLHATTWAILSLAMKADTHEVKDDADLPKWNQYSDEFRDASIKLAEAIRAKDATEGRKWFDKANDSCDACHEVFQ